MSAESVKPQTAPSNADTAAGSATISANDFLTLLVTEMKNQDPTANTDPNEYINQLVQVNSLQQLISINQTLSAGATPKAGAGIVRDPAIAQTTSVSTGPQTAHPDQAPFNAKQQLSHSSPATAIHGNLTVPAPNPAAHRIAESLGVPSRAH
jgi:flagellar basal-body rod modification protein FlgD